jgi:two-component system sensor histidine kinase UhpB
MFLAAEVGGLMTLRIFAAGQVLDETEPAGRSALLVADALNAALRVSSNPSLTLETFVNALNTSDADVIKFRRVDTPAVKSEAGPFAVPDWFIPLLNLPDVSRHAPIWIQDKEVGSLVFEPGMAADIYEKWIGFLAMVVAGTGLMLLTLIITFVTVNAALKPLRDLGQGLARLRGGDYSGEIVCAAPPEIRASCEATNQLGRTLAHLDQENRTLLRKMVSIQDEERGDIARELHDELGPLLFAIRANIVAMIDGGPTDREAADSPPQKALQSVEALQSTNRRILERLRPIYIEELGIKASIQKLLRNVLAQAPLMDVGVEIDPALDAVDSLVSQTVYRVLQEGMLNVLRHAHATKMQLRATVSDNGVTAEISDNGIGMPTDVVIGRGLTGMRERIRALGGTLEFARDNGHTFVRCSLPFPPIK